MDYEISNTQMTYLTSQGRDLDISNRGFMTVVRTPDGLNPKAGIWSTVG